MVLVVNTGAYVALLEEAYPRDEEEEVACVESDEPVELDCGGEGDDMRAMKRVVEGVAEKGKDDGTREERREDGTEARDTAVRIRATGMVGFKGVEWQGLERKMSQEEAKSDVCVCC